MIRLRPVEIKHDVFFDHGSACPIVTTVHGWRADDAEHNASARSARPRSSTFNRSDPRTFR
jgi:hypothetical protein